MSDLTLKAFIEYSDEVDRRYAAIIRGKDNMSCLYQAMEFKRKELEDYIKPITPRMTLYKRIANYFKTLTKPLRMAK